MASRAVAVGCCVIYGFRVLMACVVRCYRVAAPCAAVAFFAGSAVAQPPRVSKEPIVIDAVVANIDDTANTADFTTISVTQAGTRITAEKAHATDVGSKNSRWIFSGRGPLSSEN